MKAEKRTRGSRLQSIRVSEYELAAIRENARWAGVSLSEYVRESIKLEPGGFDTPLPALTPQELEELHAASDEINAIAKANHIHKGVDSPRLQDALTRLRRVLAKLPAE